LPLHDPLMEIVTTCINCVPASASIAINSALAMIVLALAVYRTA
jgi:hypothetical protein